MTLLAVGVLNLVVLSALFIYIGCNNGTRKKKSKGVPPGYGKSKGWRNCWGMIGGSEDAGVVNGGHSKGNYDRRGSVYST